MPTEPAQAHTAPAPAPTDRGSVRRSAFLEAARAEFLANGYEAANVNEVVRRAGGSLATLYNQFGSKEGLFLAVMEDQHERFSKEIVPACAANCRSPRDSRPWARRSPAR